MGTPAPTVDSGRRSRLLTVPNVLSLLRLASVPVFVVLFVTSREEAAVILYAAGATSDFLDGFIARRTHTVTELGKLLDPLADRIFIVALAVALVAREVLPLWLALVVIARDVLVLSLFPALESRGIERIRVNFVGKTATASLLAGLTVLAWSETTFAGSGEVAPLGMAFCAVGAILYWVAGALYAREAIQRIHALRTSRVIKR
jgi:cardiolipin synthase (CMP-forming)